MPSTDQQGSNTVEKTRSSSLLGTLDGRSLVAIAGIALALVSIESYRYPAVTYIAPENSLSPSLFGPVPATITAIVGLLAITLVGRLFPRFQLMGAVGYLLASLLDVGALATRFGFIFNGDESQAVAFFALTRLCSLYLLLCWIEIASSTSRRNCLALFIIAILLSSLLQALAGIIQTEAAAALCTSAPLFSCVFFLIFRSMRSASPDEDRPSQSNHPAPSRKTELILLVAAFAGYGVISYFLHNSWLPAQQITLGAFMVQELGALGSLCAGILLLLVLQSTQSASGTRYGQLPLLLKMLVFLTLTVALFVATFSRSYPTASLFTTLTDLSYKLILFSVWLFALTRPQPLSVTAPLLLAAYQCGAIVSMFAIEIPFFGFLSLLASLILIALDLAKGILKVYKGLYVPAQAQKLARGENAERAFPGGEPEQYEETLFSIFITERFGLTRRESEIAPLLEAGCTPKEIAERLTISLETAKTHRRNILHKAGAESPADFRATIENLREGDFQDYMRTLAETSGEGDGQLPKTAPTPE